MFAAEISSADITLIRPVQRQPTFFIKEINRDESKFRFVSLRLLLLLQTTKKLFLAASKVSGRRKKLQTCFYMQSFNKWPKLVMLAIILTQTLY